MGQLFIGTSGWIYGHWTGIFYPEDLPAKDKLRYFSKHFKTAEINYSFYHLPRPTTYQNWYNQVSADFIFAVKASRFITHIKRLEDVKEAWKQFLENALNLKEKLGPILFQFPPSFKATPENIKRLEEFLKTITLMRRKIQAMALILRYALEFRHKSWCDSEGINETIYKLLKKHNVAWVISDSPSWQKSEAVTADFVYIRMHGSKILFASKYTKKELQDLAQKIKKWLKKGLDVYCYFNNDAYGYAVENAKELLKLCKI
ncbi:MAG: DUF72 domain-containing protein [Patescibacteria group bacterium]|nr:DUF72 domain-containing protein [Patescibacteria group bacterium]